MARRAQRGPGVLGGLADARRVEAAPPDYVSRARDELLTTAGLSRPARSPRASEPPRPTAIEAIHHGFDVFKPVFVKR
ncbi:hypothetical protein ACIRSS_26365 [Amycolatopsis sp. NPDC101161]|uniref:hypothetical protein n=1 Tax=Amycolatopsis sp. NPDC101161 TaxID=3363940 RepID=UPI0037F84B9C